MSRRLGALLLAALCLGSGVAPVAAQSNREERIRRRFDITGGSPRFQFFPNDPRALPDFTSPGTLFVVPGSRVQHHGWVAGLGVVPLPPPAVRGPEFFTFAPGAGWSPNSLFATTQMNRFFFLPGVGFLPTGQPFAIGNFGNGNGSGFGGFPFDLVLGPPLGGTVVFGGYCPPYPYLGPIGWPFPFWPPFYRPLPPVPIAGVTAPPPTAYPTPPQRDGLLLAPGWFGADRVGPPMPVRPGTLRERMQREHPSRPAAPARSATASRFESLMREGPITAGRVEQVGATAVVVEVATPSGPARYRFPHDHVFFFADDALRTAGEMTPPPGATVLVPDPISARGAAVSAGEVQVHPAPNVAAERVQVERRPAMGVSAERIEVQPRPVRRPVRRTHRR